MEILWFDSLPSTQLYLEDQIKNGLLRPPVLVACKRQVSGIGSRGNTWEGCEGNLFFSFAIDMNELPDDLQTVSGSIYFGFLMKTVLAVRGSKVWLKWPNDLYVGDKKVGGIVTKILENIMICGVGINLVKAPGNFGVLDVEIPTDRAIGGFLELLLKRICWKEILKEYRVEFISNTTKHHIITSQGVDLSQAELCEDGSLEINGKKVYSLR